MYKIIGIVLVALLLVSYAPITNAILLFLLAGAIPGTKSVVPYWAMMVMYCLLITVIGTIYIEHVIGFIKSHRTRTAQKNRMPRRRYGNI